MYSAHQLGDVTGVSNQMNGWNIDFSMMDGPTESAIRAIDFSRAVDAGVDLQAAFAHLIANGATPAMIVGYGQMIANDPNYETPQAKSWFSKIVHIIDPIGVIAATTRVESSITNKIWNSKIGDLVRAITPKPLRSSVQTGLNEAVSGFSPGAIPGLTGTLVDVKQQGLKTAALHVAEQGVAFAAGAGGAFSPGSYGGSVSNALEQQAIKTGISAGASALLKKPGPLPPIDATPALPATQQTVQAGALSKSLLIGLPIIAVLGLILSTKSRGR